MPFVSLFLLSAILANASSASVQPLTVAAASDLQWVLKETASRFEAKTGVPVRLSFGSSGNLFSQIENGAPYDLFFSADVDYARELAINHFADPGSLLQYASGKIVLWVPKDSPLDLSRGLDVLRDPSMRRLAIANPQHAPYGRAAEMALKKSGLWPDVSAKLVQGENISQTAQLVQSGNADAGILALSLVVAPAMKDQGKYYVIPADLYPPLKQACIIVNTSPHKAEARQFLEFVNSPEVRQLFEHYGFSVPAESSP
jgi:molybdate transport system substrate-binding protein